MKIRDLIDDVKAKESTADAAIAAWKTAADAATTADDARSKSQAALARALAQTGPILHVEGNASVLYEADGSSLGYHVTPLKDEFAVVPDPAPAS